MHVPRRARAEQRVEQTFPQRGHVLVTGFELSTRFPFGFFRLRRRLRARNVDLVIYPRLGAGRRRAAPAADERGPTAVGAARRGTRPPLPCASICRKTTCATSTGRPRPARDIWSCASSRPRTSGASTSSSTRASAPDGGGDASRSGRALRGGRRDGRLARRTLHRRAGGSPPHARRARRARTRRARTPLRLPAPPRARHARSREPQRSRGRGGRRLAAADLWAAIASHTSADPNFVILLTTAAPGTIPAHVWRTSHVIHL